MCLAVPAKILKINDPFMATVDMNGVKKEISVELLDNPEIGDYVIVHVGYALSLLDQTEAEQTLNEMKMAGLI